MQLNDKLLIRSANQTCPRKPDRTSAIAFQNQNNFAPAAKFSFPSALKFVPPRRDETKLSAPAGYSSRQPRKSYVPFRAFLSSAKKQKIFLKARLEERAGMVPSEAPLGGAKRGESLTLCIKG